MKNERKEELKDEIKNRISLALKDPILQQGFEIICKNLAELEKENAELRNNGFTVSAMTEQQLKVALEKGEQLEKENAELKCECRKCVYSDCPCILSDYGKDRNGICDHFKDVFDEIVELKERNRGLDAMLTGQSLLSNELEEQLTNAKKLLAKWVELYKPKSDTALPTPIQVDTEQFLKEVEK